MSNAQQENSLYQVLLNTAGQENRDKTLIANWLETPLGPMVAMADDKVLYLLEFVERKKLEREVERMRQRLKRAIVSGKNAILEQIEEELGAYFSHRSHHFNTPLVLLGTDFQRQVWQALQTIPVGDTWSYKQLAGTIGRPTATRAVANANGANQLAIVIPCHRVIQANNGIGGYGGGVARKEWLLSHERAFLE